RGSHTGLRIDRGSIHAAFKDLTSRSARPSDGKVVPIGEHGVALEGEFVRIEIVGIKLYEVRRQVRVVVIGGTRRQSLEQPGKGADPVGRNDIRGKRLPYSVFIRGQRIINDPLMTVRVHHVTEIAIPHAFSRNGVDVRETPLPLPQPFVGRKPEEPVGYYRPSGGNSKFIPNEFGKVLPGILPPPRDQTARVIAVRFKNGTVELIGSASGHECDGGWPRKPGIGAGGIDTELLHGV